MPHGWHVIVVLSSTLIFVSAARGQVLDEDRDRLPGAMVGPTRAEIEDLIRSLGRDPVTPELVDRIDSLYRPRCASQRIFSDLMRKLADKDLVARIDAVALEETKKPASTRALIFRLTSSADGEGVDALRLAFRDDREREEGTWKTVRGKVMEEGIGGRPISGAVVSGVPGVMTRTDARGNYTLKVRPPKGEFPLILTVEAPGYALTRSYIAWADMPESDTKDFRLPEAVPFGGRVIDGKGRPIAGADLDLSMHGEAVWRDGSERKANFNLTTTFKARTDEKGNYAFRNIPPDLPNRQAAISLNVSHPRFLPRQKPYAPNELLGPGWEITLEPGCIVSGVVVDEEGKPVANATVQVTYNPGIMSNPMTTDADGRFLFGNLPSAAVQVIVMSKSHLATTVAAQTRVGEPVDVKITARVGHFITGKVVGEDGNPVGVVLTLQVKPANGDARSLQGVSPGQRMTETKIDGTFRVGPMEKGKYVVTALVDPSRLTGVGEVEAGGAPIQIKLKSVPEAAPRS